MAAYSAFFSSGLLAPHLYNTHNTRATTPPPSSPVLPSSPGDLIDIDSTPTPAFPFDRNAQATPTATPSNLPVADQPRLRKRRSSVTLGVSPMTAIKSPMRNAGAALHRGLISISPARSRNGSLSTDPLATDAQNPIVVNRKRSSSGTSSIRPRRTLLRRAPTAPTAPPPTVPLPDIPSNEMKSPTVGYQSPLIAQLQPSLFPSIYISAPTRPPLNPLAYSIDNHLQVSNKVMINPHDNGSYTISEEMKEN